LPTIRSGCKIKLLPCCFKTFFSMWSVNRDLHKREAQITAMNVRGYRESN
jgi:hypothetical protein